MLISPFFAEAKTACLDGRDILSDRKLERMLPSVSPLTHCGTAGGDEDIMLNTNPCLDQAKTAVRRSQVAAAKLGGTPQQHLSVIHGG